MSRFYILFLFIALFNSICCFSQQQDEVESKLIKPTIFETLTNNVDSNEGTVILTQDDRIKQLVFKKKEKALNTKLLATTSGFRVQVFSSNEQKTAKVQAYKIEERIKEKFPEMAVYVSYLSPFWKVRIGDCVTTVEANSLRDEIKREFPEYQQETYIVKDQILMME
ncbi:MAG: SPOR domain-containing protein [Paludibacteraceae bacterium]|nr:SPOR domain-containing protein [Paludibacteraceae bacterium]MBN2787795.1 SPOR domain-containing protein [Paludibacteraceae bacterium]